MTATERSATQVLHQYVESILAREWARVEEFFHPEYTYTGGDGIELAGPEAGLAGGRLWLEAFPDLAVETRADYSWGNTAISELVASGTHQGDLLGNPATGKRMSVPLVLVLELRDGKIHRERMYLDLMTILAQLGIVSPPGEA